MTLLPTNCNSLAADIYKKSQQLSDDQHRLIMPKLTLNYLLIYVSFNVVS